MVRLEKILYEQFVNNKAFKRQRIIGRPSKWYTEARNPIIRLSAVRVFAEGLTGSIFRLVEPFVARFTYQWQRDYLLQRGLAMEDLVVFQDRELRRDPFFEHIMRENFHPYTWTLFNKRRARYYKVERAVRGTYAPDWLRAEAEQETLANALDNKDEFDNFVYQNYMSDITPQTRVSALQKYLALEFLLVFGILRPEAWDRLFYNEIFYSGSSFLNKDVDLLPNPFSRFNLQTDDGRRQFEIEVNRMNKLYPGAFVRSGEQFDFQRFYALDALRNGKDVARFDPALISELRAQIEAKPTQTAQKKERKRKTTTYLPQWLHDKPGHGIQTQ